MKFSLLWFLLTLAAISGLAFFGPAEKSLGNNVKVVYLHGAWVWTAMIAFGAAAGVGVAGIILRKAALHRWSLALGRTGLFFWITYLPLSIWASATNWNGLFLTEPRWRVAFIFSVVGLLMQVGLALIDRPVWASWGNLIYLVTLVYTLNTTEQVMHPPSPIFTSDSLRIQLFFSALVALCLVAALQITLWWWQVKSSGVPGTERV